MTGPWENYAPEAGPWTQYAALPAPEPAAPVAPGSGISITQLVTGAPPVPALPDDPAEAAKAAAALPLELQGPARDAWADRQVAKDRQTGDGLGRQIDDAVRRIATNIPGLGAWANKGNATIGMIFGEPYDMRLAYENAWDRAIDRTPTAVIARDLPVVGDVTFGDVEKAAGLVGGSLAMPAVRVAKGMGVIPSAANAAATGGLYAGVEGGGRGDGMADAIAAVPRGVLLGGVVGGGMSGAGALWRAIRGAKPADVAQRRVAEAISKDIKFGGRGEIMSPAQMQRAEAAGQPVLNVDVGGDVTRRLARAAADTSEDAAAKLARATRERVSEGAQAARIDEALTQLTGARGNAAKTLEELDAAAKLARKPLYDKAYAKGAAGIQVPDAILTAPAVRAAMRSAEGRLANRQAVGATTGVFPRATREAIDALRKSGATETEIAQATALSPRTLEFWDVTKQALDDKIGAAGSSGKKSLVRELTMVKDRLVAALDDAVPDYAKARGTAAGFFRTESAVEAGQKFASEAGRYQNEAVKKVFDKMKPQERTAFREGYISKKRQMVAEAPENRNLAAQMVNNAAERQRWEIVFGKDWLQRGGLRDFIGVERRFRDVYNALEGGSKTARYQQAIGQLAPYPIYGAIGYYGSGQDWRGAAAGLAARRGGAIYNQKIASNIADILTKRDPRLLHNIVPASALPSAIERFAQKYGPRAGMIGGIQ